MTMPFFHRVRMFLELVRFSHTLFALPFALASMLVAAGGIPSWKVLLAILVCMAAARNSAMAFNRLVDARWDAQNPRTAKRHIPAKLLSPAMVKAFIGLNGVLFVAGAGTLNPLALLCALPVWLFLLSYSYWKRFSWSCHAFLGVAVGMSPLGAWIAVRGEFALFPALLGLILALWIAGFDVIYATQDEQADRALGLHSIPVQFGTPQALRIAMVLHGLMLFVWGLLGWLFFLPFPWWLGLGFVFSMLVYIHGFRRSSDLERLNQDFFLANVGISLVCLLSLAWIVFQNGGTLHVFGIS